MARRWHIDMQGHKQPIVVSLYFTHAYVRDVIAGGRLSRDGCRTVVFDSTRCHTQGANDAVQSRAPDAHCFWVLICWKLPDS